MWFQQGKTTWSEINIWSVPSNLGLSINGCTPWPLKKHIHPIAQRPTARQKYWQVNRLMTFFDSRPLICLSKQPPTLWGSSYCDYSWACVFVCMWSQRGWEVKWMQSLSLNKVTLCDLSPCVCRVDFVLSETDQLLFLSLFNFINVY